MVLPKKFLNRVLCTVLPKSMLFSDWDHTDNTMMRKTRTGILCVPPEQGVRENLRQLARKLVCQKKLQPPVDFNILSEISDEIIEISGYDRSYHGFAIVLVNNEIWR